MSIQHRKHQIDVDRRRIHVDRHRIDVDRRRIDVNLMLSFLTGKLYIIIYFLYEYIYI